MSNDWDAIFSGQAKPTGVAAPAAKHDAVVPPPASIIQHPSALANQTAAADVADDLFGLLDNQPGGEDPDDSQQPAALAAAKSTIAQILQEQPAPAAAPVPAQPAPAAAEPEKKKRGRGPAKKEPVTAEKFVESMNKLPGGSQAAETLFPEIVAAPVIQGTQESTPNVERENAAIEAAIRFLAEFAIRRLQS